MLKLLFATALAGLAVLCVPAPIQAAPRPLTTGIFDDVYLSADPATRDAWYRRTADSRAGVVRIQVNWSRTAPANPGPGFRGNDPADPAYDWAPIDAAVRGAAAHGLEVMVSFVQAPRWAEGPGRASDAFPGSWRPNPGLFGAFAGAAARRYSGSFPDPQRPGATLPHVRYWLPWNEPNLSRYLTPQWTRRGGGFRPAAPAHYRRMLNAAYRAIKRVSRRNRIGALTTAPYGDLRPGGGRISPVRFARELFCLRGRKRLRPGRCRKRSRLDALTHHPYSVGGPRRRARNADDVALPDIRKLTRVLRAARRFRRVKPRRRKQLWVTEVSWDSSPPDPNGVPLGTQASWLQSGFHILWRQRVTLVAWFHVRDAAPIPSYGLTNQSGIFFRDGRPKPSARAFRFPFVTGRINRRRVRAWGKAPAQGPVMVERRSGGAWLPVKRLTAGRNRVFVGRFRLRGPAQLRARAGSEVSLTRSQR